MPLPLLMGLGAGIMGGAQYLMKKQDDKDAQGMLESFNAVYNSPLGATGGADPYIAQARAIAQGGGFWGAPDKTQRMEQLMDMALRANENVVQRQFSSGEAALGRQHDYAMEGYQQSNRMAERENSQRFQTAHQNAGFQQDLQRYAVQDQYAQARAYDGQDQARMAATQQVTGQLYDDFYRDLGSIPTVQDNYRKGMDALASNNPADVMASTFNFFNMVEPGGIVRDAESGQYRSTGGSGSKVANYLNDIAGKGLDATTRANLEEAMANQYRSVYEKAQRINQAYGQEIDRNRALGLDVPDFRARTGFDFGYGPQQSRREKILDLANEPAPKGYTLTDPNKSSARKRAGRPRG